jgi:hypothetical protein
MKIIIKIALLITCACYFSGCTTLSRTEKATLQELESYGVSQTEVKIKHPGTAAALNILPGIGNFYLATGTDESSQWLYGGLNLLFWPLSIVWGIPEAAIDATTINKKETVNYYTFDRIGKTEFSQLIAGEPLPEKPVEQDVTADKTNRTRR